MGAAINSTEAGQMMTPAQKKEYTHQKAAELVGATNKIEAGNWISHGRQGQKAAKPAEQSNLSSGEIDNVFGEINVGSVQKQTQAKPAAKSGGAFIPMRNPMKGDAAIKAASRFEPPKTTAKAAPAAAKPKSQMDKNMEERAARKRAQADEVNKRVYAERAAKQKAKTQKTNESKQLMPLPKQGTVPFYGGSTTEAAKALKLKLLQNKS